jgi:hypothetical protein
VFTFLLPLDGRSTFLWPLNRVFYIFIAGGLISAAFYFFIAAESGFCIFIAAELIASRVLLFYSRWIGIESRVAFFFFIAAGLTSSHVLLFNSRWVDIESRSSF